MALRKALAYSKKPSRPFTRKAKRQDKSYIKAVPQNRIIKYFSGSKQDYENNKHNFKVKIISEERIIVQIRDNAIESSRMLVTKAMEKNMSGLYYLELKAHPHHFLRENKSAAAVAGADRISTGMSQSYGSIIGRAARIKPKQEIVVIYCLNDRCARFARDTLEKVKAKFPCKTRVVYEKIN